MMAVNYCTREAQPSDYEFLFILKERALRPAIERVFGWDEAIQRQIHQQEWEEARPQIILVDGEAVGSVLIQPKSDQIYFGRFLLLPELQGRGIGGAIMQTAIQVSNEYQLPIRLLFLQGNRAGELYRRHGFTITSESPEFVYMQRDVKYIK